jgi:two-component system chemotaxis response regulator CheY
VHEVLDPLAGLRNSERPEEEEVDAIVRATQAMRGETPAPAVVKQAATKTCLIVDDSRVIRKVSSKIVTALGYKVIEAQDGIEGLAHCKKAMPHIVLTDWDMPEMDGLEFVKQLRAIPTEKAPAVVFCTSKSKAADVQAGVKAGANDYIVKPFTEDALKAKLERLAGR